MRFIARLVAGGGIAAFFFFSWVIMRLWNHILVWHLGLVPPLTYLQAAGLWFLIILLFAWVGIGANRRVLLWRRKERDWDKIGERIEARIKRGLSRWVEAGAEMDWDDLGERIEEKIKRKFREWIEE